MAKELTEAENKADLAVADAQVAEAEGSAEGSKFLSKNVLMVGLAVFLLVGAAAAIGVVVATSEGKLSEEQRIANLIAVFNETCEDFQDPLNDKEFNGVAFGMCINNTFFKCDFFPEQRNLPCEEEACLCSEGETILLNSQSFCSSDRTCSPFKEVDKSFDGFKNFGRFNSACEEIQATIANLTASNSTDSNSTDSNSTDPIAALADTTVAVCLDDEAAICVFSESEGAKKIDEDECEENFCDCEDGIPFIANLNNGTEVCKDDDFACEEIDLSPFVEDDDSDDSDSDSEDDSDSDDDTDTDDEIDNSTSF